MSHKSTKSNKSTKLTNRRVVLKSAVVAGAAVTVKTLPKEWTAPVIESVMLPAHATTSVVAGAVALTPGVFGTTTPLAISPARNQRFGPQFALLDQLIPAANAGHLIDDICASDDDSTTPGMSNVYLRINADMSVDAAVDSLNDDNSACQNFGSVVTATATTIPDITIQLDDDEFVRLTNMFATSNSSITGMYTADNDNSPECGGSFTVSRGASFPAANDCRDD